MVRLRNKKIDIIVGIPTYNEADSISNTVQKIDKGLSKYFPEYKALIINCYRGETPVTHPCNKTPVTTRFRK